MTRRQVDRNGATGDAAFRSPKLSRFAQPCATKPPLSGPSAWSFRWLNAPEAGAGTVNLVWFRPECVQLVRSFGRHQARTTEEVK